MWDGEYAVGLQHLSFNGAINTTGQSRSCTKDRAKLSASDVPSTPVVK
ncbi:hypothetical protein GXM_07714 [Nostoc sphaeroides CCNUC1]|uniref:Uncharacterized protein n=1 Tax=Nostoc sphaeroides CCNUC1 TaxID=2653204 RepID=A0A5P8WC82_9NOSO|nr:hypothetical protein GXM_07714 [Nostoc sphaeroides CCNUC1]